MTPMEAKRFTETLEYVGTELRDALYELADAIRELAKSTKGGAA